MKHPDDEKLAGYVARQIDADETVAVILHLESCRDCAAKVQTLSTAASSGQMILMETDGAAFHLDYDEHLRPFVDYEADAATREIVETHVRDCAACAFELRELREFAENLRLQEIEKSRESGVSIYRRAAILLTKLSQNFALPIAAGAIFLLLTTAIWLLIRTNQTSRNSEVAKITDAVHQNRSPVVIDPTPEGQLFNENSSVENSDTGKMPEQPAVKQGEQKKKNNSKTIPSQENNREDARLVKSDRFDDLPEQFRENIRSAMSTGRLVIPSKLDELVVTIKPRGGSEEISPDISPDREIVKETKPKFSWKAGSLPGSIYVVEIFDEKNDSVAISPQLKQNFWTPEKSLEAGKSYQWELRVMPANSEAEKIVAVGKFSILDAEAQNKIKNLKSVAPLQRGIIYASLGLIEDARREFRIAAANSPKSNAYKFLQQLQKYR